jgi:hypothetical protein
MSETPIQDTFFQNLLTKDIQAKAKEIIENSLVYYNKSIYLKFNNCFSRYIKNIKDLNEYDMAEYVGKYFNSCLMCKNYLQCAEDIKIISKKYFLFDNNCYIFLLKFFAGDFNDAFNLILSVSSNISTELYNYLTEEDLAFYFSLCILINYNEEVYKEILVQNETEIYKLIEKYPKIFEILEIYSKCQFEKVCVLFDKTFREKIIKNKELVNYEKRINMLIKNNILKEILSLSSEIKLEDLAKTLKIDSIDKLIDMIIKLIDNQNFPVKIDDINKIVYYNKKNELDDALQKTIITSKKNLAKIFNFTLKRTLKGKNKISQLDMNNLSQIVLKEDLDEKQLELLGMNDFHGMNMMNFNQ